jgi:hypothetical protein
MTGDSRDINGAAKFLNTSPRSVRRRLPFIKHYKTPFGLRFLEVDLLVYLRQFSVEPSAPAKIDLDTIIGPRHKRRSG